MPEFHNPEIRQFFQQVFPLLEKDFRVDGILFIFHSFKSHDSFFIFFVNLVTGITNILYPDDGVSRQVIQNADS